MRLALLTEIPAPYRIPLFNALAERVELRVLFLSRTDPRRSFYEQHEDEWRFEHAFLRGPQLRRGARWLVLNVNDGEIDGKRVLSPESARLMRELTGAMPVPRGSIRITKGFGLG